MISSYHNIPTQVCNTGETSGLDSTNISSPTIVCVIRVLQSLKLFR